MEKCLTKVQKPPSKTLCLQEQHWVIAFRYLLKETGIKLALSKHIKFLIREKTMKLSLNKSLEVFLFFFFWKSILKNYEKSNRDRVLLLAHKKMNKSLVYLSTASFPFRTTISLIAPFAT